MKVNDMLIRILKYIDIRTLDFRYFFKQPMFFSALQNIDHRKKFLLCVLLFSTLLIPPSLHFRICLPDEACEQPVSIVKCHEQQQHAGETVGLRPDECGDCHHSPINCGRANHYFSLLKTGGSKLHTRIIVPLLYRFMAGLPRQSDSQAYSEKTYFRQYFLLPPGKLLALNSTILRC